MSQPRSRSSIATSSSVPLPAAPPAGLRLTTDDFAAPGATGEAYLFERLLGWGVGVAVRLRAGGVRLELGAPPPLDPEGDRELFFVRATGGKLDRSAGRSEIHRVKPTAVAFLRLRLAHDAVEVALVVPAKAKAEREHMQRLALDKPRLVEAALEALPLPFALGPEMPPSARVPTQRVLAKEASMMLSTGQALWIGWTVPRATALAHAATLDGELSAAMLALGELFRQVVWPPPSRAAKAPRAERTSSETLGARRAPSLDSDVAPDEFAEGDEPSATPMTADDRLALLREARARQRPTARASLRLRSSAGGTGIPRSPARVPPRPGAAPARKERRASGEGGAGAGEEPVLQLERGAEVLVLVGPFAGRIGVVQETDAKGDARVLFGLLASRIPARDLSTSLDPNRPGGRPALASSHRRGRKAP